MNRKYVLPVIGTLIISFTVSVKLRAAECFKDPDTEVDYKIVVTANGGATVYDAPDGKSDGEKIKEMDIRFVLTPEDDKTGNQEYVESGGKKWYRISADGETPHGWVVETDVSLWKTRSALKPSGVVGREFVIKEAREGSGQQIDDIIYDGTAPDNYQLLAPILRPRENEDESYSVLVFGANTQGTFGEAISDQPKESMAFKDAKLEIVFVVDTTASMQPLLDGVKETVNRIVEIIGGSGNAESLNERVRFGLVEYQDSTPGLTPARVRIKLADAKSFAESVKDMTVATQGSGDWQEDVIAGLKLAVDRKRDGTFSGNVGWSQNSSKNIILCGDASAQKADNPKSSTKESIEQVLKVALPDNIAEDAAQSRARILCHAIMALNEGGKGDWEECRRDFKEVAACLSQNDDEQGIYAEMEAKDSSSRKNIINLFANQKFRITADVLLGKKVDPDEIKKSEFARGVYRLRDGKPLEGVAFGVAHERNENDQEVAVEAWMMRYIEMQRLKSRLRFLHDSFSTLSPTERKSSDSILNALMVVFAVAGVGEPDVEKDKLSKVVGDIPLKNDLLNMTIDDIRRMNDKAYTQWLDRLKGSERRCGEILNLQPGGSGINEWIVLGEKTDAKNNLITFIPIDQLP